MYAYFHLVLPDVHAADLATVDSSSSSTFKDIDQGGFKIEYVDGSGAKGDYVSDNFEIGGSTIKSLEMGLATTTVIGVGVAGIGYDSNEGIVLYSGRKTAPHHSKTLRTT